MVFIEKNLEIGRGFLVVRMIGNFCDVEQDGELHFVFAVHQVRDEYVEHILGQSGIFHERRDAAVILVQHKIRDVLRGLGLAVGRERREQVDEHLRGLRFVGIRAKHLVDFDFPIGERFRRTLCRRAGIRLIGIRARLRHGPRLNRDGLGCRRRGSGARDRRDVCNRRGRLRVQKPNGPAADREDDDGEDGEQA